MSAELFNLNPDLKRLREEGYVVKIEAGTLVMSDVPYVNAKGGVSLGKIRSSLCMAGDTTVKPDTHVVHFEGTFPCDANSRILLSISAGNANPPDPMAVNQYLLSSKPDGQGYLDYYQKMSTYATIISGPASVVMPGSSPRKVWKPADDEECIFNYIETASDRVGIGELTARFVGESILILGSGGTGGYILDLVAKTPVAEIRIVDDDDFLQHNAFRAPGAPSIDELREIPKKVDYFTGIYSKMHRNIKPHVVKFGPEHLQLLEGITFAFLCMDAGGEKQLAVTELEQRGIPFIDVGMGLEFTHGSLGGILRATFSSPENRHTARSRIPLESQGADDLYASNIQVADLNALNACLAVIKWKKYRGFYRDLEKEHHCSYTTDGNMLVNGATS